jgi:uncharacterized membrane protein
MAKLNARTLAGAVIGAAIAAGAVSLFERGGSEDAAESGSAKEQCYGIAKAGENECGSANGSHTCSGLAKVDFSGQEWKTVAAGTCLNMGGKLEAFDNPAAPDPDTSDGQG